MKLPPPVPLASRDPLLWACTEEGAFVLLGDHFHLLAGTQGLFLRGAVHHRGRLFLGTPQRLLELEGSRTRVVRRIEVSCLAVDGWGDLWVGTERRGLLRAWEEGWKTYRAYQPLPDDRVRGIAEDGDGLVYVGTARGLSCYDRPRWMIISRDWVVRTVLASPLTGRVWVAHEHGLACFLGLHLLERLEPGALPCPILAAADASDGSTLLVGGNRGLFWWRRGEGCEAFPLPEAAPGVPEVATHLFCDPDGALWVFMPGRGLGRLEGRTWTRVLGEGQGLVVPSLLSMAFCPTPT